MISREPEMLLALYKRKLCETIIIVIGAKHNWGIFGCNKFSHLGNNLSWWLVAKWPNGKILISCWWNNYIAWLWMWNSHMHIILNGLTGWPQLIHMRLLITFADSTAYELLTDIVENKNRLKDIRQLSPQYQTSSLEAFHSVLNHFAPKMIHFHYDSQFTR